MPNNMITYDTFCAGSTKTLMFNIKTIQQGQTISVDLSKFNANLKVYKFGIPTNILLDVECTVSGTQEGLITYELKTVDTMNFTEGVYCFQLTLTDTKNEFIYKKQGNWYVQARIGV